MSFGRLQESLQEGTRSNIKFRESPSSQADNNALYLAADENN